MWFNKPEVDIIPSRSQCITKYSFWACVLITVKRLIATRSRIWLFEGSQILLICSFLKKANQFWMVSHVVQSVRWYNLCHYAQSTPLLTTVCCGIRPYVVMCNVQLYHVTVKCTAPPLLSRCASHNNCYAPILCLFFISVEKQVSVWLHLRRNTRRKKKSLSTVCDSVPVVYFKESLKRFGLFMNIAYLIAIGCQKFPWSHVNNEMNPSANI